MVNKFILNLLTARSTFIPVNVKLPNFGTQTPLPVFNYFAIYCPRASQIVSELAASLSLLAALKDSLAKPVLLAAGSPLKAAPSLSALNLKIIVINKKVQIKWLTSLKLNLDLSGKFLNNFDGYLLSSQKLWTNLSDSVVRRCAWFFVKLRDASSSFAIPIGRAISEHIVHISPVTVDRAESFNCE